MTKSYSLIAMVGRDGQVDKEQDMPASGLSPFKSSLYRLLWIAALFSYVGAAMYDVGASWLMTSLAPNPLFDSLITTATTLPILLLHYHLGYCLISSTGERYFLSRPHTCLQYLLH